MEIFIRIQ